MQAESDFLENAHIATERAMDELRRQRGIVITQTGGRGIGHFPLEFLDVDTLARLKPFSLLITAARAQALGLPAQDTRINATALTLADMHSIADPLYPVPAAVTGIAASATDSLALRFAKQAALLPALLLVESSTSWLTLDAVELQQAMEYPIYDLIQTAEAQLPIAGVEHTRIVSFRARYGASVHLALVIGNIGEAPLTRVHSSCVTGDILGSLRCDCGDQLHLALDAIRTEGSGIMIYLHQEGRGIGITNKLRAYQLQERGIDTYTANRMLGFDEDERDFSIAANMLKHFGINAIRMLTNNPGKLAALEKSGIAVKERVPLISESGKHNRSYINAKIKKAGHLL